VKDEQEPSGLLSSFILHPSKNKGVTDVATDDALYLVYV
jgi:hypothetical protein